MIKQTVFALVAASIVLSAGACNTVRGAGKDVKSAGAAVEKTAN